MTTAFTIDGENWTRNESLSELVKAISERNEALTGEQIGYDGNGGWSYGVGEYADIETDMDCQMPYFFYSGLGHGIDYWIIRNCGKFLPPSMGPGDWDGQSAIRTIAEQAVYEGTASSTTDYPGIWEWFCKNVIGLYRSATDWGFRRSINGTTFVDNDGDDGHHQPTDYISGHEDLGHWIWEDRILALNYLCATLLRRDSDYTHGLYPKANAGHYRVGQYSLAFDFSYTQDDYDAYGPDASSAYPRAGTRDDTEDYVVEGVSSVVDYYVPNHTLISAIKLYFKSKAMSAGYDDFSNGLTEDAYGDTGVSLDFSSSGSKTSGQVVYTPGSDLVYHSSSTYYGFQAYGGSEDLRGVIFWNFTNGLAWP